MEKTVYAVHGFQAGRRQKEVLFEDEQAARAYAARLGSTIDCVLLAKQVVPAKNAPLKRAPSGFLRTDPTLR